MVPTEVVSTQEWDARGEALLVKENKNTGSAGSRRSLTHARDALAAGRRRLPMVRVEKAYAFLSGRRGALEHLGAAGHHAVGTAEQRQGAPEGMPQNPTGS
jgi:predicted dithiol-disulfide oxidoreductase (DUF899 family)